MVGKLQLGEFDGDRLIPRRAVRRLLSVDRHTMIAWENAGVMPGSINIGNRERFYLASRIEPWLRARLGEAAVAALNSQLPDQPRNKKARAAVSVKAGP